MRKAQISQVFTYLIIILVVGLIVILGYKGIISIMNVNCEKQRISFEKDLIGYLEGYSDKGSVHEELLDAPCDVDGVCFVDAGYCSSPPAFIPIAGYGVSDDVIISSVEDCTANIFFMGEFTEVPEFLDDSQKFSNKIKVTNSSGINCFKVSNGKFKFLFKGQGRKTQIESGW